jgi:hypothetical protein
MVKVGQREDVYKKITTLKEHQIHIRRWRTAVHSDSYRNCSPVLKLDIFTVKVSGFFYAIS